jgi:tRNA(fMet)-specific endonuclease VapC
VGLILDTTVVIDLLRGREGSAVLLEPTRDPLMISTVTVHEVHSGMRAGEEEMTRAMLSSLVPLPFGEAEAELTGAWWREFRSQGVTLDFRDLAIAATAVARDLPLATSNLKDFPMAELRVEQWPPPPSV